ncbi:MAG: periplasmic heavy metal sensor [Opitutaceae bacterium]|jgi:Spy/CpxP family protein refolding chaperone
MKSIIGFFIIVVVVAAAASFCTVRWAACKASPPTDPHAWIHEQLQLTPAQHTALDSIEAKFQAKRSLLTGQLRAANHELALALAEGKADSPKISAAVEKSHHYMGELQMLSIEHLFAMRQELNPQQGDKLLQLAQQALQDSP